MSKIDEIWRKKLQNLHFLKIWFLVFFWELKNQKIESSKMWKFHQTTPNFYRGMSKKGIKYNIWTIWTIPENFFFWPSRGELVKILIFSKNNGKIMFFHFLEFQKFKNHDFSLVFSTKMKWDIFRKIKIYIKINQKIQFLHFL